MPSHALFLYPWSQSFCGEQGASRNPVCKWVFLHTSQTTASQQRSGLICAYKDLCFRSRACAGLKDFICWAQDCRQHLTPGMGRLMSTQPPLGQGQGNSVSHPSTNQARPCLASEIRRDRARSGWYGRRQGGILSSQQDWTSSTARPSRSHAAVSQRGVLVPFVFRSWVGLGHHRSQLTARFPVSLPSLPVQR